MSSAIRARCSVFVNRFFALFLLLPLAAQAAETISGVPYIVDGDTLVVGGKKIRLQSIDAPESDQVCLDVKAAHWTCGIEARDRLAAHIQSRVIDCAPTGRDVYGRTLAVCRLNGDDLNAWMVREGLALAFVRYSNAYVRDEEAARTAKRGIWGGAFVTPWDWRHRNTKTVVLGAAAVPVNAQAELLKPVSAAQAPYSGCVIKGNVNRKGERIYFRPGQLDYARVNMDRPGKRWFRSEEEVRSRRVASLSEVNAISDNF